MENVCSYPHNITEKMAKDRKNRLGTKCPYAGQMHRMPPKLAPNISGDILPIRDSMAFSSIYRLKRSGRIDLYRHSDSNTDKSSDKRSAPVPDCSWLPEISKFNQFDSLVQVQNTCSDSLVIACDTEFVTCSDEDCRIAVSFQFAVIDGFYLHEFVFLRCHPYAVIELSFCLGMILDYLGLYKGVLGSDIIHYQSCSKFQDGKPVVSDFNYVDVSSARLSAVYKYKDGNFVPEQIPNMKFVPREYRDWVYFHFATDFSKVKSIPITLLCHFGRIDISGFNDYERHMKKCSDVQGGLISMQSTNVTIECHYNSSDWHFGRNRHKYYPSDYHLLILCVMLLPE